MSDVCLTCGIDNHIIPRCVSKQLQERRGAAGCHCIGCAEPPGQQAQHEGPLCPGQPSETPEGVCRHAAHQQRLLEHAGCRCWLCGAQDDCRPPERCHQGVRPVTAAASICQPGPQEHCGHARASQCSLKPGGKLTANLRCLPCMPCLLKHLHSTNSRDYITCFQAPGDTSTKSLQDMHNDTDARTVSILHHPGRFTDGIDPDLHLLCRCAAMGLRYDQAQAQPLTLLSTNSAVWLAKACRYLSLAIMQCVGMCVCER